MSVIPIPTSRVSDQFSSRRLLQQLQFDQRELARIQTQVASGQRLLSPSDDAPAALRAIGLQRLLDRKAQIKTNLETSQSFLAASDSALNETTGLLTALRATILSVSDSAATENERQAAIVEIERARQQFLTTSNQVFRGRYLFSGAQANTRPFDLNSDVVTYNGDEGRLLSYSDTNVLFDTNVSGQRVFGAISEPVRGAVDLNPVLSPRTRLADLRGGAGIRSGSILVSDGLASRVIDLSHASTIGDVAALLTNNPPQGRKLTARVTATGLTVQLDAAGGGNLTIAEVGAGTTASELGIKNTTGVGTNTLVGSNLNPRLTRTTSLDDILGVRATALVPSQGDKNDLIFEAALAGPAGNGATIQFVDDAKLHASPGLTAGNEVVRYSASATAAVATLELTGPANDLLLTATTPGAAYNGVSIDLVDGGALGNNATASYNAGTKTLTLAVDHANQTSTDALIAAIDSTGVFTAARDPSAEVNLAGGNVDIASLGSGVAGTYNTGGEANTLFVLIQPNVTTANQVIAKVNAQGAFTARLDQGEAGNDGTGSLLDSFNDPAASGVTAGGSGVVFDRKSGLSIQNGGKTTVVTFESARSIEDVLNLLNGSGAGVLAEINASGSGIDLRSRASGGDFSIGENGGQTATQLGLRSLHAATTLAELNHGAGVHDVAGDDFIIHRKDGVEFSIDLAGAQTIGDVLNRINTNATNLAGGQAVVARLSPFGNGIELVDDDPTAPGALSVRAVTSSFPGADLGLFAPNSNSSGPPTPASVATGLVTFSGANNDLSFASIATGPASNGIVVSFVDNGLGPNNETVTYDALGKKLIFGVDPATTTANRVIATLAADPVAGPLFVASLASADGSPNDGSGLIDVSAQGTLAGGDGERVTGRDTNPAEVQSIFTALARLKTAIQNKDAGGLERALGLLDDSTTRVTFARGELGARQQTLDTLQTRLQDEEVELQGGLSRDLDVDLASAISEFTGRQAAFQAALQTTGAISKLTLLDYL